MVRRCSPDRGQASGAGPLLSEEARHLTVAERIGQAGGGAICPRSMSAPCPSNIRIEFPLLVAMFHRSGETSTPCPAVRTGCRTAISSLNPVRPG